MRGDLLEERLVEHLTAMGLVAKPYPQDPANYVPDAYPGEVLIRYTGRKLQQTDVAGLRVEENTVFEIVYVSQELRGENGLYIWINRVCRELHGHTIEGIDGVLHMESEELLDEYNGTWQYGQKWTIKTTIDHGHTDDYADRPLGDQGAA